MPLLPPEVRAENFEEVELGLSEEAAVKEARRCLRCDLEARDKLAASDVGARSGPEPAVV